MSYLKDPWLQVFLFLALASGALAAGRAGVPSLDKLAASLETRAATPQSGSSPGAIPFHRTLEPKTPGRWIVDAAYAADADTEKLGEALANAAAGDTVYLRAGTYKENLAVRRDLSLVGLGDAKAIVIDSDASGPTFSIDGAKASIKNVTISHSGARPGKAIESLRSTLELTGVFVKANPQDEGLDMAGGSLNASNGSIEGGDRALDAHDGAKIAADHMAFAKSVTGVYLQDATAQFSDSSFSDARKGLAVGEQGQAAVVNGIFARDEVGVWANRGGQAKVSAGKFPGHGVGALADERGRVETKDCSFSDGTQAALAADSAGELIDRGSSIVRGRAEAARSSGQATLALIDTQIEDSQANAVFVNGGSAALSGVKIARGAGEGVVVSGAQAVTIEKTSISEQKGCALEIAGSEVSLKSSTLSRDGCGVRFSGEFKSVLDSDDSDLTGNDNGPFIYDDSQRGRIAVRGKNNRPPDLASLIQ